jgi:hypothetical protein
VFSPLPIANCRLAPGETDPFNFSKLALSQFSVRAIKVRDLPKTNWQLAIGNRQCL